MTMILESIKDLRDVRNEHAVYVKDCNVLLKLYSGNVAVIDLNNAMKPGKTCKKYSFSFDGADNGYCGLYQFLDDLSFNEFAEGCRKGNYARNSDRLHLWGISYHEAELKACRVISPFARIKKQDFTDRINGAKLAKAILAGQIKEIICTGRYTDDYYNDAVQNFCKDRKVTDLLKFADELLNQTTCFSAHRTDNPKVIACGWGTWECYEAILA